MIGRCWVWAKPKLAICAIYGLLIEAGGSWRAGHWLDADGWIAAEDAAMYGFATGLCRLVLLPVHGAAADCEAQP